MKDQVAELTEAQNQQQSAFELSAPPVLRLQTNWLSGEIADLQDEQYELVKPMAVIAELSGDKVIVSDQQVSMYGHGSTLNEALQDYQISLIEYFGWLESNEKTLAEQLKEHLSWLRQYLRRRRKL